MQGREQKHLTPNDIIDFVWSRYCGSAWPLCWQLRPLESPPATWSVKTTTNHPTTNPALRRTTSGYNTLQGHNIRQGLSSHQGHSIRRSPNIPGPNLRQWFIIHQDQRPLGRSRPMLSLRRRRMIGNRLCFPHPLPLKERRGGKRQPRPRPHRMPPPLRDTSV